MTTLEQVEKLCAMANISYEEAKAALDAAKGDLLEAIIYHHCHHGKNRER